MAERGQNLVVPPEILVDCLRLGRRYDDDDVHALPVSDEAAAENAAYDNCCQVARQMAALFDPVKRQRKTPGLPLYNL
jgi:hypothetical protein